MVTRLALCYFTLFLALLILGCTPKNSTGTEQKPSEGLHFIDRREEAGVNFTYTLPGPRPITILQSMPGGAAFLDYDNDGNLDLLCISYEVALFKGDGKGKFTDVSTETGLKLPQGWWMGCAVGDYDNDGYDDIYISRYQGGVLLHNEGGKGFRDVTQIAGIAAQPWGSACAFGDYDNDGKLDLFIGNYVEFNEKTMQLCQVKNVKTSCSPTVYNPLFGKLMHNNGNGKFQDATPTIVPKNVSGKVLGAHFIDFDGMGHQSLFLANDETPSDLLHNQGAEPFKNIAEPSGVAFQTDGKPYGGMGGDWGDFNEDGRPDLFMGTFALENKMIYVNEEDELFTDRGLALGIAQPSMLMVTFGAKWLDADNDGDLDLIFCNGYIADNIHLYEPSRAYKQKTMLFENENDGRKLTDRGASAGEAFSKLLVGRGLATGDYDNDGLVDAFVVDADGKPLLLHNESKSKGNWISLKLEGARSNRSAYGAKVRIEAGGKTRLRHYHADGSYFSSSDPRIHIGIGQEKAVSLTIEWPSNLKERFTAEANKTTLCKEGTGQK
ncbi:MAG: CRTAC1 family protein [Armatimonas sp.]